LYLNAVAVGTRYEGTFESTTVIGNCSTWNDWNKWDQTTKDNIKQFMMSSMDSLQVSPLSLRWGLSKLTPCAQNYFFWTWKISNSTATGKVESPFWSYLLALEQGWAPTDPRDADGQCDRLGAGFTRFTGELQSWQVGGNGANVVPTLNDYKWPLTAVVGFPNAATLPTYTPTGPIPTLPVPTFTDPADPKKTIDMGNGWNDANDKTLMSVPDGKCAYPDAWNAQNATVPVCNAAARRREVLARKPFASPPQPAGR
jgi:glucan 1,3-beta-glucosidase